MEVDHIFPASKIKERQFALIAAMNKDHEFGEAIMQDQRMKEYVIDHGKSIPKSQTRYEGKLVFFEEYYHDIDNLWLICSDCNGFHDKGNREPIEWLSNKVIFSDFFQEVSGFDTTGIILKTEDGKGLGAAIYEYFNNETEYRRLMFKNSEVQNKFRQNIQRIQVKIQEASNTPQRRKALKSQHAVGSALTIAEGLADQPLKFESESSSSDEEGKKELKNRLTDSAKKVARERAEQELIDTDALSNLFSELLSKHVQKEKDERLGKK